MAIVSVSLDDETISDMERMRSVLELSGRSELVRASVRALSADLAEKEKMSGTVSCVLTATHDESEEEKVTRIKHMFEDVIKTHLHCKLRNDKCLEIFVLEGQAAKVADMTRRFQRSEGMEHVRLIVA